MTRVTVATFAKFLPAWDLHRALCAAGVDSKVVTKRAVQVHPDHAKAAAQVMAALALCSTEQAAAAQAAREGDKGAVLGVADWMAEEVIIRGGE